MTNAMDHVEDISEGFTRIFGTRIREIAARAATELEQQRRKNMSQDNAETAAEQFASSQAATAGRLASAQTRLDAIRGVAGEIQSQNRVVLDRLVELRERLEGATPQECENKMPEPDSTGVLSTIDAIQDTNMRVIGDIHAVIEAINRLV